MTIRILRPSGFEFAGQLQDQVLAAVRSNVRSLRRDLAFVNFDTIEEYAEKHPRAARYVASIRSQGQAANVGKAALKRLCKATGVQLSELDGTINVEPSGVMSFLEVLDRRRYEVTLVENSPERYRAPSRSRLP